MMRASSIRSLIRQPSALSATIFRPLMTTAKVHEDRLTQKNPDTQFKLSTTYFFEGFEASEIITLMDLLKPNFPVAVGNESLVKVINHQALKHDVPGKANFGCHSKISMAGYEESDLEILRDYAEQFGTKFPIDEVEPSNSQVNSVKVEVEYSRSCTETLN